MKKRTYFGIFAALLCVSLLTVGCVSQPPVPPQPPLNAWFDFQTNLAATLNQRPELANSNYQIGPILGGIFPIGTTFIGIIPASSDCQFQTNIIFNVQMEPWPVWTESNSFNFSLSVPAKWAAAIGLTISANLAHSKAYYVRYSDLSESIVYDDTFHKELVNGTCHSSLMNAGNQQISIIRGQILGTLDISSSKTFSIGGTVVWTNVIGGSLQYNTDGEFLIQQTNTLPLFNIISDVTPQPVPLTLTGSELDSIVSENASAPSPQRFALSVDGQTKDVDEMRANLQNAPPANNQRHNVVFTTFKIQKPTLERTAEIGTVQ